MFTGIIRTCVPVLSQEPVGTGARLRLARPDLPDWNPAPGASIAVAGLPDPGDRGSGPWGPAMVFDLSQETLDRPAWGPWSPVKGSTSSGP
ncbi:MAG: hypothetical protein R3F17_10205 [Planctomycetota bacterium]